MALPRDTLGPYPLRGLTATPTAYGAAVVAENLEWDGDWCGSRKGTAPVLTSLGYVPAKVTYADEFRPRRGNPLLVVAGETSGGGHRIQTYLDGSSTPHADWTTYDVAGRPYAVDYQGYRVMFTPGGTYTMWAVDALGDYAALLPNRTPPTVGADAGAYRDSSDPLRGIFGCVHLDRLFVVAEDDPSFVWYSGSEDIDGWPLGNYFAPFGGSTEPLTGLVSVGGSLLAFHRTGIASVAFAGAGLEQIQVVKEGIGAVTPHAIASIGKAVAFLSDDGLLFIDSAGNVAEDLATPINPILRRYQSGFGDATLRYFGGRRQLWLLLPQAGCIFVLDIRSGNWSTYTVPAVWQTGATDTARLPQALGSMRSWAAQDTPILGSVAGPSFVGGAGAGVVRFDSTDQRDWAYGGVYAAVRAQWLSHGVPMQGQDLHRLYLDARVDFRDSGAHNARCLWLTQGQPAGAKLYIGTQYVEVVQQSPVSGIYRVGSAVVGSAYAGADLGELDFEARIPLSGEVRGRWLQLGISSDINPVPWKAKRWRLTTRVVVNKRSR